MLVDEIHLEWRGEDAGYTPQRDGFAEGGGRAGKKTAQADPPFKSFPAVRRLTLSPYGNSAAHPGPGLPPSVCVFFLFALCLFTFTPATPAVPGLPRNVPSLAPHHCQPQPAGPRSLARGAPPPASCALPVRARDTSRLRRCGLRARPLAQRRCGRSRTPVGHRAMHKRNTDCKGGARNEGKGGNGLKVC